VHPQGRFGAIQGVLEYARSRRARGSTSWTPRDGRRVHGGLAAGGVQVTVFTTARDAHRQSDHARDQETAKPTHRRAHGRQYDLDLPGDRGTLTIEQAEADPG